MAASAGFRAFKIEHDLSNKTPSTDLLIRAGNDHTYTSRTDRFSTLVTSSGFAARPRIPWHRTTNLDGAKRQKETGRQNRHSRGVI